MKPAPTGQQVGNCLSQMHGDAGLAKLMAHYAGTGHGTHGFSWSAAMVLHIVRCTD